MDLDAYKVLLAPWKYILSLTLSSFLELVRLWDPETLEKICRNHRPFTLEKEPQNTSMCGKFKTESPEFAKH